MPADSRPPDWTLEHSEPLADYEIFSVRRDRVRSPEDGSLHDFHVAESPAGVTVLAFTPEDELVLVRQFRHPLRAVSLETPSGIVDEGEDPSLAALRELREETGFEGSHPEILGTMVLNPSWQTSRVHVVRVRGARRTAEKELDAGEDTRVLCVSMGEALAKVRSGEIAAAVSLGALAYHTCADDDRTDAR